MTDWDERDNNQERRDTFVVPGTMRSVDETDEELDGESLATEVQQARDLGAASRSCVAILVVLLVMALLICVFLTWAWFIR
jgi:hypothetical protein